MKKITRTVFLICLVSSIAFIFSFRENRKDTSLLTGSWRFQYDNFETSISFVDDYCSFAAFNQKAKKFFFICGGPYKITGDSVTVQLEFHSLQKELIGTALKFKYKPKGDKIIANFNSTKEEWTRIDDTKGPLVGVWRINGRKQGDIISDLPLGARRTLKILTGKRFQWVAINIDTKEFFGTGGGHYTFENGKYTEHIEFFSRDSSRVGASLSFDGKIENGLWHHSGLSSRGEPIYEIWKHLDQ